MLEGTDAVKIPPVRQVADHSSPSRSASGFTMRSADARDAKRLSVLDTVDGRKHDTEASNGDLSTGTRVLFLVYSSHHRSYLVGRPCGA